MRLSHRSRVVLRLPSDAVTALEEGILIKTPEAQDRRYRKSGSPVQERRLPHSALARLPCQGIDTACGRAKIFLAHLSKSFAVAGTWRYSNLAYYYVMSVLRP